VNDIEELIRKADEYAEERSRTGDPQLRPMIRADYKIAYLQGVKDGIRYAKEQREQQS
jgi:hypothetical protein